MEHPDRRPGRILIQRQGASTRELQAGYQRAGYRHAGVSTEWGDDDMGGTITRSIVDWGNANAMGAAVDCDRG
jgi:hypothetical protein